MHDHEFPLAHRWQEDVDRLLADPARLFIMGYLQVAPELYYRVRGMCEQTGAASTAMTRHIRTLRQAGYVDTTHGSYHTLWARPTPLGERALADHVQAISDTLTYAKQLGETAPRRGDADRPGSAAP